MGRGDCLVASSRIVRVAAVAAACCLLANCSAGKFGSIDPKYGTSASPRVVDFGEPVPKGGGSYRVGKPYVIAGRTYFPEENINYRAEGTASWYGDDFHGRLTANGEVFDMQSISAAHPTLPMPSYVRVTNLANRRSIVVRVNDRGPYSGNRVIDVSVKTAKLLGFHENGLAKVRVEYVGRAPLEGSDDLRLVATLTDGNPAPAPSEVRVASARPFLPEISEPVAVDGKTIPMPPERPFRLGQTQQARAMPEVATVAAVAPKRVARVEASALPAPVSETKAAPALASASGTLGTLSVSGSSPVSAYAPTGYNGPAAFVSGRGLY
jgi:rare lipoprotein A